MKKLFSLGIFTFALSFTLFAQVKVTTATCQRNIAGMGGVFMNYEVSLTTKSMDSLVIDSVTSIANGNTVIFYVKKISPAHYLLTFGYSLTEAPKCRTCPDVGIQQTNLTKGVLIYYKRGKKNSAKKVKSFKRLDDFISP